MGTELAVRRLTPLAMGAPYVERIREVAPGVITSRAYNKLRTVFELVKTTLVNARRHRVRRLSAALAFYALLSLAPMVAITVAVAGLAFGSERIETQIVDTSRMIVGPAGTTVIENILSSTRRPATSVVTFIAGIGVLLFGASRVFLQLQDTMNSIWEADRGSLRRSIRNRAIGMGLVLATGMAFVIGLVAQAAFASAGSFVGQEWQPLEKALATADWLLTVAVVASVIACLFRYVPRTRVEWSAVLPGAIVTTILILLGRVAFGLYLSLGFGSSLQGAAGSLVVLILWIFYMAQVVFFGAELTRTLHLRRTGG